MITPYTTHSGLRIGSRYERQEQPQTTYSSDELRLQSALLSASITDAAIGSATAAALFFVGLLLWIVFKVWV